MRKINLTLLSAAVLALVALSGCDNLDKMKKVADDVKFEVTPQILELHGDSVKVKMKGTFPPKFFIKKAELEVTPVLKFAGKEVTLPSKKLQGQDVQGNNQSISFDMGGSFEMEGTFAYEDGMMQAQLFARGEGSMKGKKLGIFDKKIADGVIVTPLLLQADAMVARAADKFVRTTSEEKGAKINFLINQSDIRSTELKKEEIKALQDYIAAVAAAEKLEIKDIVLEAYASPDGPIELNTKLSEKRKDISQKFLNETSKKAKIQIDANAFKARSTAEDWDGFQRLMQKSNVKDKDLILRVLSMYTDPVVREKEIKNITAAFDEVKKQILPDLRRAEFKVTVTVNGFTDEELKNKALNSPSELKIEEILFAATLFEGNLDKQYQIYKKGAELFADDWRTHNNCGWAAFKLGRVDEAEKYFKAANDVNKSGTITNNLGAVQLMRKDYAAAKATLSAGTSGSKETSYNQAVIALKEGKYEQAGNLFNTAGFNTFNNALQKVVSYSQTKNERAYDSALEILDKVENKEDAYVYYLKAIIGARRQNSDLTMNNLRTACDKKADLKEYAQKDLEFFRYFNDAVFSSIVK
jgi:tetratricopeptide (TPR) repeat protein